MTKTQEAAPKITIFCDFDGTLTSTVGQKTVNSKFYKSLYLNTQGTPRYSRYTMKNAGEVQQLLQQSFQSEGNKSYFISDKAVDFLKWALNQEAIEFVILTRNRPDYVQALLTFHEVPTEPITITWSKKCSKGTEVSKYCYAHAPNPQHVFVLDDSERDYKNIIECAQARGYEERKTLHGYHQNPGCFSWSEIQTAIEQTLTPTQPADARFFSSSPPTDSTAYPEARSPSKGAQS